MRFMHWSYLDLFELPAFHYEVLIDMIQTEARQNEHQRALAESRRR